MQCSKNRQTATGHLMKTSGYKLQYKSIGHLTRLGWLAKIPQSPGTIEVLLGDLVERTDQWFVEGSWDGEFSEGDFDRSAYFFGSGIRLREDGISVVPSRATIDSLYYCRSNETLLVSNSMVLLMSAIDAQLDPQYNYGEEFIGAVRGIDRYKEEIPVICESVRHICQLYYANLQIEDGSVSKVRPSCSQEFDNFHRYYDFMASKLAAFHENATSAARQHPMVRCTTLSTGYDSIAVSVLAMQHCGVDLCVTTKPCEGHRRALEDGRPLAEKLGLKTVYLDPSDALNDDRLLLYYSANPHHFESIFDTAAQLFESRDSPVLLFTGYQGDKVWNRNLGPADKTSDLRRTDMAGKGLCEVRLKSGFINAAAPFLGARQIAQIHAISVSPEMARWSVGGDYDKPIPRRICEEAGLERASFGQRKDAVATHGGRPSEPGMRKRFLDDVREHYGIGFGRLMLFDTLDFLSYHLRGTGLAQRLHHWKRAFILGHPNLRMLLFIWAVNSSVESTRSQLSTPTE